MKRKIKPITTPIIFLLFTLIGFACSNSVSSNFRPPDNSHKVSIEQGVWGNVWFWEGDFMSSTDDYSNGRITAVEREIYVYEATSDSMVVPQYGTFHTEINSNLIAVIHSDENDFFQITLQPGKYSFFVKEGSKFYANSSDGEGHVLSAKVEDKKVTKRQIDITYKATY